MCSSPGAWTVWGMVLDIVVVVVECWNVGSGEIGEVSKLYSLVLVTVGLEM